MNKNLLISNSVELKLVDTVDNVLDESFYSLMKLIIFTLYGSGPMPKNPHCKCIEK
jgi:hypothetical protein